MDLLTAATQNNPTGWLKPAPGQTKPMDAATQMNNLRQHSQQQQQQLDQLHFIAKDVAANLNMQAYREAQGIQTNLRPDVSQMTMAQYNQALVGKGPFALHPIIFKTDGQSVIDRAKQIASNPILGEVGALSGLAPAVNLAQTAGAAAGFDVGAPNKRDPYTKAAYLPAQYKYQNTEIAIGRALAAHPELINKPYLLMTAALSDMQAHDIKYLATMDDMMKIYATSVMSENGLQNAAKTIVDRMQNDPRAKNLQLLGSGVGKVVSFTGDIQRDLETWMAEAAGRTVTKTGGGGMQPAAIQISGGSGAGSALFGGAQTVGNVLGGVWNATGEQLFGIQHAIRTESDIRRTQGDAAANQYLGTWFGTAVAMNYAGKGFALALKGLEKAGLKAILDKAGVAGTDAATLEQLHALAKSAKIGDARWLRVIQASQDWLMHQPQNVRMPMIQAYARKAIETPEDASLALRAGQFLNRNLSPVGSILKDAATYGGRHWHIPLNLELAAQLVNSTNGFGTGHEWDKSWERTADGSKYKDPITHAPVSFGREVASAVGAEPNTWWYNMVSGPLDFLSWFEFDPFQSILAPISETKQLENTGTLKRVYGGIGIRSATDVYNLNARSSKFRSFVDKVVDVNKEAIPHRAEAANLARKAREDKIARKTAQLRKQGLTDDQINVRLAASRNVPLTDAEANAAAIKTNARASSIARLYKLFPELSHAVRPSELEGGENFMKLLSEAQSHDEVVELFASIAQAHQYLNTYRAPSYSRFMSAKDWARVQLENRLENKIDDLIVQGRYADAAKVGIDSKFYRMFTSMKPVYWDEFRKFSNQVIKVGDPKSLDLLSRTMRASGVNPMTADLLINRLAMAQSAQEWKTVYWNWARDTFHLYVESQLQELVVKAGLTPKQAAKARNILSTQFGHAAEELGNPFGGGGVRNFYSGADVNNVANANRPFPSGGSMTETAGLGSMHEHYLPLFDYNKLDDIVRDLGTFLKSNDGRKEIVNAVNDMIAAPINAKIAEVQKQMKAIEENFTKMKSTTVPMRDIPQNLQQMTPLERISSEIDKLGYESEKLNEGYEHTPAGEDLFAAYQDAQQLLTEQSVEEPSNIIYDAKNQSKQTLENFIKWYDEGNIHTDASDIPIIIRNSYGEIAAVGTVSSNLLEVGAIFDEKSIPFLLKELAKKTFSHDAENWHLFSGGDVARYIIDNHPELAELFGVKSNYVRHQIASQDLQNFALGYQKSTLGSVPYDLMEKLKWVHSKDAQGWVDHVNAESYRYDELTYEEKAMGEEWTKHRRFLNASANDGTKFIGPEYSPETAEIYIDEYRNILYEIRDSEKSVTKILEGLFPDFTPREISDAFDNALDDLFTPLQDFENEGFSHSFDNDNSPSEFFSTLAKDFRHSDGGSSFEKIYESMPSDVIDHFTSLEELGGSINSYGRVPQTLLKYTKSSQRERAWLRSFTLDSQYQGFRHSLGDISQSELRLFKEFAKSMDSIMSPIDTEIRLVRTLNPDQVAGDRKYSAGMGDFPGSIEPGREYVTPLPFTVDASTGFVRPMAIDEIRPGVVLNDPSYQSTAFGKYFGLEDTGRTRITSVEDAVRKNVKITHTAIHYTVPPGISGIDARAFSINPHEGEFILQRGLTSVVVDTEVALSKWAGNEGVLNIYAAILPQGAQENPLTVYMRNRQAIEDMAFNKLMDGTHNWADILKDVENADAKRVKAAASALKTKATGAERGVIDRLRRDIQMRGETEGLTYQQVDVINDFMNLVGKDMFEGVRINTISRAKDGMTNDQIANYDFGSKMINLFSRAVMSEGVDRAFLHEAWHHLSSFLHPEEVAKFNDELMQARTRFMRANTFKGYLSTIDDKTLENLELMKKNGSKAAARELQGINYMKQLVSKGWHKNSKNVIWDALPGAYRGGLDNYRLESLDEWFAETMYDRTRKRMETNNPIIEWMYQVIGKVLRGINKLTGAANSRRVFDDFITNRYDVNQANQMPMQMRLAGQNMSVTKAKMSSAPHLGDPTWQGLDQDLGKLRQQRSDLISAATGDYRFYDLPEKIRMTGSNGIHSAHTIVRQRLIDDYFRKMSLATGSFSMRVSASEAIPNAFRVGVGEYTKTALFSHVERSARQFEKDYKRAVSRDEMSFIQKRVYDVMRSIGKEDIEFYGKTLPGEIKHYARRIEKDFTRGLVSGASYDKFVERMTKDILINGYTIGGLSADHGDIYSGGRDAIGAQFRNLANGHGSGTWIQSGEMNANTLAGLGKIWQDIAHDPLQRSTAKILDDYLNPANFRGSSFQERLDAATAEINKVTKQMVRKNPAMFDNMMRATEGNMLASTRDRISAEILLENGLPPGTPMQGRLLDELKDRLQKVDSLEEWASANIQHILWATHGRGASGGFSFPQMGDRVFHRRILSMLGKGEAPEKVNEVEKLIVTPDQEHARVLQHLKGTAPSRKGGERSRYHDVLYHPSATFHDASTFDPAIEGADSLPALIKKHKPKTVSNMDRASSRRAVTNVKGVAQRYGDQENGKVHALFPDNIPIQSGDGYDAPNFIDRFSDRIHDTISRRVIDSVSRRPLYAVELNAQLDFLEPLVKSGAISEDLAFSIAQSRAINVGVKYVHNPQDRMLFEQWSRAYAPFWFAQNQALRRMGRFALQDPAAFEEYMKLQLMFMQSNKASTNNIDSQNATLMPGSIFGGRLFTSAMKMLGLSPAGNVPIGLTGSLTSLNSVFPWNDPTGQHTGSPVAMLDHLRPQFGPLVALPLQGIQSLLPYGADLPFHLGHISTKNINKAILGDVGSSVGTAHALIPNPMMRSLIGTALSFASGGRISDSELTSQILSIQYGLIPQYYAQESNKIIAKAQAQAKRDWIDTYGMQAAATNPADYKKYLNAQTFSYMLNGYESPSDPSKGFKGMAEYWSDPTARHKLVQDTGLAAQIIYLGRTAISFFSPLSTQTTQVQPELQKFIHDLYNTKGETQKVLDLIAKHPEFISFLEARQSASTLGIPLDASINMAVFQEQNKDLFKESKFTAGVSMLLPYKQKGSQRDSQEYNLQKNMGLRSKYTPDEDIKNLARQVGNFYAYEYLPKMTQDLYGGDDSMQRMLIKQHAKKNKAWVNSLGEGKTNRQMAFESLQSVLKIKGVSNRPGLKETVPLARQLIADYRDYQQRLAQAMPGNYPVIQGEWQQHVDNFKKKNPVSSVLVDSLFKNLSLRDVR